MGTYSPTTWVEGVTGISAAEMNRIETGVDDAHDELNLVSAVKGDDVQLADDGGDTHELGPVATREGVWVRSTTNPATDEAIFGVTSSGLGDRLIINHGALLVESLSTGLEVDGNRVLTVADEGAGNGLDADTVDALQASQFARADATDTVTTLRFANGSAGAPSVGFSADTDSGMYRTTSRIAWSFGGVQRGSVDNVGRMRAQLEYAFDDTADEFIGFDAGTNRLYIGTQNANKFLAGTGAWAPNLDNTYDLGSAGLRYDDVYATNGTIQTSDPRTKEGIVVLDDSRSLALVRAFEPIEFRFRTGRRQHYGFDADQIGRELERLGVDFAGFVDPAVRGVGPDDVPGPTRIRENEAGELVRVAGGPAPAYLPKGLRMNEFVPILWSATQQLLRRLELLEEAA